MSTMDFSAPGSSSADPGIPGLADAAEIGRGGFAIVYKAEQPEFRRTVAAKVLTVHLDHTAKLRFERECQALGSLSDHPGIVTVYSAGYTTHGQPYLLMPFLSGGSYDDILKDKGPLPWREVVDVGVRVADALAAAHAEGILHRDLKPANLLRSRHGHPVLADFGIARVAGSNNTTSSTSTLTGSVHYMSPELIDGQEPSVSSDVYALGATLYTMLAGRPAFESDSDVSIVPLLNRIMTREAPPLLGVPETVNATIARALSKQPEGRYPTALAFGRALQHAQAVCGEAVTPLAGAVLLPDDVPLPDVPMAPVPIPAITPAPPPADVPVPTVAHVPTPTPPSDPTFLLPQLGDQPPLSTPPPAVAGGGKGRKGLLLGLVGLGVVAAIAVVVFLVVSGGGGEPEYDLARAAPSIIASGIELDDEIAEELAEGDDSLHTELPAGVAHVYIAHLKSGQFARVRAAADPEAMDGSLDLVMSLLDPDGHELTTADDTAGGVGGHDPHIDWVVDIEGTYAFIVAGYHPESEGGYELAWDIGDTTPLTGETIEGSLDHLFDLEVYSVSVEAAEVLTATARSSDFDAMLGVLAPSGSFHEDDDGGGGVNGTDAMLVQHDTEAGTYYVGVTAHNNEGTGTFTLEVTQD